MRHLVIPLLTLSLLGGCASARLLRVENAQLRAENNPEVYGTDKYHVALFGDPTTGAPSWRTC